MRDQQMEAIENVLDAADDWYEFMQKNLRGIPSRETARLLLAISEYRETLVESP